jgi:hypothetical protein
MLPAQHADWARAMVNEVHHIDSDREALQWALGCALACTTLGVGHMIRTRLAIARWLLGVEIVVCLGPLTLLWLAATYIIVFHGARSPNILVPTMIGVLGPVGLWLALRAALLRRAVARTSFAILAASFAAMAVLQIAKHDVTWFGFDWRVLMLNSILPCIACAHLALGVPAGSGAQRPVSA